MTQGFNEQTFADAVNEYRNKTKNYPWANNAEREKAVAKKAKRLLAEKMRLVRPLLNQLKRPLGHRRRENEYHGIKRNV